MQLIEERNPDKIALNYSTHFNISDGLDKTDFDEFLSYLPEVYKTKVVSSENLATAWIETRTDREMIIYNQLVDITHEIINKAFSEKVITPGITTTSDVEWWLRDFLPFVEVDCACLCSALLVAHKIHFVVVLVCIGKNL